MIYNIGDRVKIILNQHQTALKEHEGCVYMIKNLWNGNGIFYELFDDSGKSFGWWHPAYFDPNYTEDFLKTEDLDI